MLVDWRALAAWHSLPALRLNLCLDQDQPPLTTRPLSRLPEVFLGQDRYLSSVLKAESPRLGDGRLPDEQQHQGDLRPPHGSGVGHHPADVLDPRTPDRRGL